MQTLKKDEKKNWGCLDYNYMKHRTKNINYGTMNVKYKYIVT